MRKLILISALALAALAPATTAQAGQPDLPVQLQDICVMTWHHIGEICTSQLDDIAKAKAQCLATSEDKTACARIGLIIDPSSATSSESCIQVWLGYQGCLLDSPCWVRSQAGEVPVLGNGPDLYCTARS